MEEHDNRVTVVTPERTFTAEMGADSDKLYTDYDLGLITPDSELIDHSKMFGIEPDDPEHSEPFYSTLIGDVIIHFGTVTFTMQK